MRSALREAPFNSPSLSSPLTPSAAFLLLSPYRPSVLHVSASIVCTRRQISQLPFSKARDYDTVSRHIEPRQPRNEASGDLLSSNSPDNGERIFFKTTTSIGGPPSTLVLRDFSKATAMEQLCPSFLVYNNQRESCLVISKSPFVQPLKEFLRNCIRDKS